MANLTTKARKGLLDAEFALPAQRKYPVQDKAHAANAKAKVDAKANKVLKGKK